MTLEEFKIYLEKETPKNPDGSEMTNEQLCEYLHSMHSLEKTSIPEPKPLRVDCSREDILKLGFTSLQDVLTKISNGK